MVPWRWGALRGNISACVPPTSQIQGGVPCVAPSRSCWPGSRCSRAPRPRRRPPGCRSSAPPAAMSWWVSARSSISAQERAGHPGYLTLDDNGEVVQVQFQGSFDTVLSSSLGELTFESIGSTVVTANADGTWTMVQKGSGLAVVPATDPAGPKLVWFTGKVTSIGSFDSKNLTFVPQYAGPLGHRQQHLRDARDGLEDPPRRPLGVRLRTWAATSVAGTVGGRRSDPRAGPEAGLHRARPPRPEPGSSRGGFRARAAPARSRPTPRASPGRSPTHRTARRPGRGSLTRRPTSSLDRPPRSSAARRPRHAAPCRSRRRRARACGRRPLPPSPSGVEV